MWEKVRLSELIEKPKSGEWGIEGEKIKVIRTTNFTNEGSIDFTNVVYRDISDEKIAEKKLHKGDIIIEKSGGSPSQPVGRVVFFNEEEDYLYNNFTSLLRPKKKRTVEKYIFWFLFYYYKSNKVLKFQNKTTGIINLKLNDYVDSINVPLPPLAIQQQIVAILDKADRLRQLDKAIEEKYDVLAQSIFIDMFGDPVKNEKGWKKVHFENICSFKRGYDLPIQKRVKGVIPIYGANGVLDYHSVFKVENSVIVTGRSGSIGNVYRTKGASWPLNTTLYLYKTNGNNLIYLEYLLLNFKLSQYAHGASVPTLDRNILFKQYLPSVPLELQNKFARKIAIINQMKEQEIKGEELFQALLQKAFKGELVS
ncbi:restriction endonuclease subunit S [Myroides marinus]|uniref:restriction endonuclease subunit S n=1 Tax=Myroides marinus TaxID=703342 RepID=UPI00257597AB|nr:restriction endonuclease subunit S [Myroides marinus]MDM1346494.1 restriction endonuclease subunit S [Myroides marinus]MDM1349913.1 restriction endonuclease subunit S [Myroides marinus]MDM1357121.1 restriction endonuclease subunit S [Myroides marinus]